MDEAQLIRAAQSGDAEAFKMLFETHKKKIYALAYQYTKNVEDTEDIFQDTFIKTFQSLNKFRTDEQTNFFSWLYRIGINCSIDFIRKNKKRKENAAGEMDIQNIAGPEDNQSPDRRQRDREIRESTEAVLKTIAPRQRMVFILRHYQQMSIKEISEYLNCTEGSVKKQLFRAVETFKKRLKHLIPENSYGL
ncbi:MAG: RNA polymerase sigma factor [Acidobacteria bacterium]|nr:RNA polymerase sigma factor [Acidobacteriota bacterium]MBU4329875.1 RNA polymerase sigma factor [Acidobacteriota bacterium]MCG2815249.1 RNA polymerase sigma factor [Candidatus Aminicenantes bacterium]